MVKKIILWTGMIVLNIFCSMALGTTKVPSWTVDPLQSEIEFKATQNGAPVTGNFKTFQAKILFSPTDLKNSHVNLVINTNSVSSSYPEVSNTLKSEDWFDVKEFPKATFDSLFFKKIGEGFYAGEGNLTLRGQTHPVSFTFSLDNKTDTSAMAKGSLTLRRTDFGVGQKEWKNTSVVKDEVEIHFLMNATRP